MCDKENKVVDLTLINDKVRTNQIEQWLRDGKFKSIASTLCDVQPMTETNKEELDNETR